MSLALPPELDAFLQARVSSGAYASEQEVLRVAFDLLEKRESLLAHIDEGRQQLERGQFTEYGENDRVKFIADILRSSESLNSSANS